MFPDGPSSLVEERRHWARAQRTHQAFSLLILGDPLTNVAIWQQDHGGWKDIAGLGLIQVVFLEGGWEGVSKCIFSFV